MTLNNCQYLPNRANDGDSFHVRANGKEYIFRLYYVDAPETDKSIPKRVAGTGRLFSGQSLTDDPNPGSRLNVFTREQLSRPFVVRTCFQDARGRVVCRVTSLSFRSIILTSVSHWSRMDWPGCMARPPWRRR